jgi:hypothetical protein
MPMLRFRRMMPARRGRLDAFEIAALGALTLASIALFLGKFHHTSYRGDGTFINNTGGRYGDGSRSRYEVRFGTVDLSTPQTRVFRFTGLPDQDFILGFRVSPGKDRLPTEFLLGPVVRVRLEKADGALVMDEIAQMGLWVWELSGADEKGVGPSFVYRIGKSVDIPLDTPGMTRTQRTGEAADHGWGTYFHPSTDANYRLTFEVKDGKPAAQHFRVELVLQNL